MSSAYLRYTPPSTQSGGGSVTYPLLAPNGSASAPSYSFVNQTGTGMFYDTGANELALAYAGTEYLVIGSAGASLLNADFFATNGSASAPSYSFTNGTNYGMYYSTNSLDFASNGTLVLSASSAGLLTLGAASGTQNHQINGSLLLTISSSGSQSLQIKNTGSAAGSSAILNLLAGSNSVGAYILHSPSNGATNWFAGTNSSTVLYSINYGGGSGTPSSSNDMLTITNAGLITLGQASGTQTHALNTATATPASGVLTLTNGPSGKSGNPAGYINITINGTVRNIPFW